MTDDRIRRPRRDGRPDRRPPARRRPPRLRRPTAPRSKAEPLIERGLRWRDTPREVAEAADVVFSMVTDDAALEAITAGPDGILAGLAAGKRLRRHEHGQPATPAASSPSGSASAARRCSTRPVSGSVPAGRGGHPHDHGRRRPRTRSRASSRCCASSARPSPTSAPTARACCSSSRSTSASPSRCSPSARGCCSPSAAASTPSSRAEVMSTQRDRLADAARRAFRSSSTCPKQAWFDVELMHKDIRLALRDGARPRRPAALGRRRRRGPWQGTRRSATRTATWPRCTTSSRAPPHDAPLARHSRRRAGTCSLRSRRRPPR